VGGRFVRWWLFEGIQPPRLIAATSEEFGGALRCGLGWALPGSIQAEGEQGEDCSLNCKASARYREDFK